VYQHIDHQEGIIEAAFNRDLEQAFRVFLNDPQVRTLSREDARSLFKELTGKTIPASQNYRPL
jgi:alpha-galactosidase